MLALASRAPMSDEKLDRLLEMTTRIETALWPDKNQKGILTQHDERLDKLESWRNYLTGAWAVVTAVATKHVFGKH